MPVPCSSTELGALARNGAYDRMATGFHLLDCFECGSCSFVCPAHLRLVQEFRVAKRAIRKQEAIG